MSGSIKWMVYESDNSETDGEGNEVADEYLVKVDESNGELFGFRDAVSTDNELPVLRITGKRNQSVIPRYINATGKTAGGAQVTRKFPVGDPDNVFFTDGGTFSQLVETGAATSETVTFEVTFAQGEAHQFLTGADTGLTDGDAT